LPTLHQCHGCAHACLKHYRNASKKYSSSSLGYALLAKEKDHFHAFLILTESRLISADSAYPNILKEGKAARDS
jgi:hypothetical protein